MISAAQARELVPEKVTIQYRLGLVAAAVEEACKRGFYSTRVPTEALLGFGYDCGNPQSGPDAKLAAELRKLGYKCKQYCVDGSQFSDIGMEISWDE